MKLSEATQEVLRLAGLITAYWDRELPKRHPNYPWVNEGEEDGPPPPEEAELATFLRGLPDEQVFTILLLVDIGSRGFGTEDIVKQYTKLRASTRDTKLAITFIARSGGVDEPLSDGLEELRHRSIDLDSLCLNTVMASTQA